MTFPDDRGLLLVCITLVSGCGVSRSTLDAGPPIDAVAAPDASGRDDGAVPDAMGRPRVDLVVQLRDFDAYDGARATVHAVDTGFGERHGPGIATLVGGDADIVLPNGFARDLFGELGQLWIDADGDGACRDGTDPAFGFFINNDFETGPETVLVTSGDPMLTVTTCREASGE